MRRLSAAASIGASRQPRIAPGAGKDLADGRLPTASCAASMPTHGGIFCTAPQVPSSDTDANTIASSAVRS